MTDFLTWLAIFLAAALGLSLAVHIRRARQDDRDFRERCARTFKKRRKEEKRRRRDAPTISGAATNITVKNWSHDTRIFVDVLHLPLLPVFDTGDFVRVFALEWDFLCRVEHAIWTIPALRWITNSRGSSSLNCWGMTRWDVPDRS